MKKHRFVIALVGLSLFAASSTIAADMTQANMDQHSVTYTIKGDGLVNSNLSNKINRCCL